MIRSAVLLPCVVGANLTAMSQPSWTRSCVVLAHAFVVEVGAATIWKCCGLVPPSVATGAVVGFGPSLFTLTRLSAEVVPAARDGNAMLAGVADSVVVLLPVTLIVRGDPSVSSAIVSVAG